MKRKRVIVLTLLVCIAAGTLAVAFVLLWDDGRFSASACARLEEGMTRSEISAILGAEPGDHSNGTGAYRLVSAEGVEIEQFSVATNAERLERCWCGPDGAIEVYFDEDGRLTNKWHYQRWPPPPPFWQRMMAKLSFKQK